MNKKRYEWHTIDFRPATGWRAVHLKPAAGFIALPMPGWLIQEEIVFGPGDNIIPSDFRSRRVVPGILENSIVEPAVDEPDFWMVLSESDSDPHPSAEIREREQRENASQTQSHPS